MDYEFISEQKLRDIRESEEAARCLPAEREAARKRVAIKRALRIRGMEPEVTMIVACEKVLSHEQNDAMQSAIDAFYSRYADLAVEHRVDPYHQALFR